MHREVNSGLSIIFIVVAALAVFTYAQLGMKELDRDYQIKNVTAKNKPVPKQEEVVAQETTNQEIACKDRMFEGEVSIKVWRDGEPVDSVNKDVIVRIVKNDLVKLPIILSDENKAGFKAKLVDATQEVELELNKHSEASPAEITIKGYKFVCGGMNFISLNPPLQSLNNI
jgi:hypothetical protein